MSKSKSQLSYESAVAELQEIITRLQEETTGMDDLAGKVKRAAELIRFCREKLRATEEEVEQLLL